MLCSEVDWLSTQIGGHRLEEYSSKSWVVYSVPYAEKRELAGPRDDIIARKLTAGIWFIRGGLVFQLNFSFNLLE